LLLLLWLFLLLLLLLLVCVLEVLSRCHRTCIHIKVYSSGPKKVPILGEHYRHFYNRF
jgi:hypothetical protein